MAGGKPAAVSTPTAEASALAAAGIATLSTDSPADGSGVLMIKVQLLVLRWNENLSTEKSKGEESEKMRADELWRREGSERQCAFLMLLPFRPLCYSFSSALICSHL